MNKVNVRALAVQGAGFGPLPFAVLGVAALPVGGHNLDVRAIAVQGIGFEPRLVGLQGLWPVSDDDGDEGLPLFVPRRKKKIRHDTDDDVLLFLLK